MQSESVRAFTRVLLIGLLTPALGSTVVAQSSGELSVTEKRPIASTFDQALTSSLVITNPSDESRERVVLDIALPAILDSVHLDMAELVMTVSTVCDSTDPLILTVAPVTDRSSLEQLAEVEDWGGNCDGLNMKYGTLTSLNSTEEGAEIRLDVTPILEMWLNDGIPNRGVVIRSLSEGKSTFQLSRLNAYDGANAKLEVMYSRR